MIGSLPYRSLGIFAAILLAAGGGLMLGKWKEKDYLSSLYERRDFTLLSDSGDFFRLGAVPANRLVLLVFTPDGIPVEAVKPFFEFSKHLDDFQSQGVEVFLVSRTNKEILRNFKRASGFNAPVLLDAGGAVGRVAGFWPGPNPVISWGYALVDNQFRVYFSSAEEQPIAYEKLASQLKAARLAGGR